MSLPITKADFLANAAKLYDNLSKDLDSTTQSFYDFESKCVAHLQAFSKDVLAQSISKVEESPRKKKDTE
jgi:hypothetical protein